MRSHLLSPLLQAIDCLKSSKAPVVALMLLMSGTSVAHAQMHIIVNEVGSDVIVSYAGSLNVENATDAGQIPLVETGVWPGIGWLGNPSFGGFVTDAYSVTNAAFTFGSGFLTRANGATGNLFGVESMGNRIVLLPQGYTSGTILSGRLTFANKTVAGLGLTEGTYTFTIGNGTAAETITMIIEAKPGIKFMLQGNPASSTVIFSWSGGRGFYKSDVRGLGLYPTNYDLQNFTPSHVVLSSISDINAGNLFINDTWDALNGDTGNTSGTLFGIASPINVFAGGRPLSLAALYFNPNPNNGSDTFGLVFDEDAFLVSSNIFDTNVVFPSTSGSTTFELQGTDTFSIFNQGSFILDERFPDITLEISELEPSLLVSGFPNSITLGDAINATFTASDFIGAVTASLTGNVPPGLLISGNNITGVPTAAGTYTFTLEATDGTDTETQSLTLTVNEGAVVETVSIQRYANTIAFLSYKFDPNDILSGSATHQVTAGSLPSGFIIQGDELRGQFANTGTYNFTITSSAGNDQVIHNFTYTVMQPVVTPFVTLVSLNGEPVQTTLITEPAYAVAAVLEPYSATIASGERVEIAFDYDFIKNPYSWAITAGSLPAGLILDGENGIIFGTPSEVGTYLFTVSIKDWRGRGYLDVNLTIE